MLGDASGIVPAVRRTRMTLWAAVALTAWLTHVVLIWINRFVPSVDYPQWLLQAKILSAFGSFSQAACYRILLMPVPNGGFVLPAALLAHLLPVEVAGKIVVTLYLVLFPLAVRQLSRAHGNNSNFWMVSVLLLFNVSFVYGNFAFLVGVVILLFSIALIERMTLQPDYPFPPVVLIGISISLFLAHAIPALIFILYAINLLAVRKGRFGRVAIMWTLGTLITLGVWYGVIRAGTLAAGAFRWEFVSPYRLSVLAKSFIAGWSFDPFDGWPMRAPATATLLLTISAISFVAIRRIVKKRGRSAVETLALALIVLCIVAPISVLGLSEIPQRLAFVTASLLIALTAIETRTVKVLLAGLLILTTVVRAHDYSSSSALIGHRYAFLTRLLPPDPTLLAFDDGPHHSSPARISLIPRGLHLLFQSNYNLLNGGCTPQMFSTGYVVTSPDIDRQGLDSLLSRTTLQHIRGSAIPSFITHVVLDISGGQRDSPWLSLLPAFCLVGDTTFGEHLHTVVMERGGTGDLPLSIP